MNALFHNNKEKRIVKPCDKKPELLTVSDDIASNPVIFFVSFLPNTS